MPLLKGPCRNDSIARADAGRSGPTCVIYTVARAREGVGRTWGITVKDAPGAAGGCVMPGVRRTSGRPRAGDSPRCAAPRAGEPLEPSPGIPLWASDYPADMKVRGVAWVWCSAERVLW